MTEPEDEETAILCSTIAEIKTPVPGSRVDYCSECVTEVWCSPSSFELKAQGVPLLCYPCGLAKIALDADEPTFVTSHWFDEDRRIEAQPSVEELTKAIHKIRGASKQQGPETIK